MRSLLTNILSAFSNVYSGWILWNLFLAFIPLVLSFWLFRRKTSVRSSLWWVGLVIFIAFLPNAPYLLTDIIHLIRGIGSGQISVWVVALIFIPIHVLAILLGFEAYVVSLINQSYYLKHQGAQRFIPWAEWLVHALCAVGIYLGRFVRLNSWDLVVDPQNVLLTTFNTLTAKRPVVVIVITFIILGGLYWLMKQVTLGLKLRLHYARQGMDGLD